MSKLKTTVFGFMALALMVTPVLADEESDIQSEMDALEQMLADLSAELGTTTEETEEATETVSVEGIPADFAFSTPMGQGAEGEAVEYLQVLLNADPATQVAESGVGSAGNETTYYGPATAAAVTKFQNKYASEVLTPLGLTAGTGYFGNSSIAKANALLGGEAPVVPGTPTTPTTPTNEMMEMLQEIAEAVASLKTRVDDLESGTTAGGEPGTLEISVSPDVYSVDVRPDRTDVEIAEFEIEAEDNDTVIQRLDVAFSDVADLESGGTMTDNEFRALFNRISVLHDGEEVGSVAITKDNVEEGDENIYVRVSGLDIEIAEDEKEVITIAVDTENYDYDDDVYDGSDLDLKTLYVGFATADNNGIRFLDGTGVYSYHGNNTETRGFNMEDSATAELEVSLSNDSPAEGAVEIKEDSIKENIELARFDVEVDDGDIELEDVKVSITSTGAVENDIARATLYADNVFVEEKTSGFDSTLTFDADSLEVAEGDTVELKVVADVYGMETIGTEGTILTATLGDIEYYDVADDSTTTESISEAGEDQYLYTAVIDTVLNDSSLDLNEAETLGSALLDFTIEALAGDLTPAYIKFENTGSGTLSDIEVTIGDNTAVAGVVLTESVNASRVTLTESVAADSVSLTGTADLSDSVSLSGTVEILDDGISNSSDKADIDMNADEYYLVTAKAGETTIVVNDVIMGSAENETNNGTITNGDNTIYKGYTGAVTGDIVYNVAGVTDGDYYMNSVGTNYEVVVGHSATSAELTDYIGYSTAGSGDDVLLSTNFTPTSATTDYAMDTNDNAVWEISSTGTTSADITEIAPTDYIGYSTAGSGDNVLLSTNISASVDSDTDYIVDISTSNEGDVWKITSGASNTTITEIAPQSSYTGYEDSAGNLVGAGDVLVSGGFATLFDELTEGSEVDVAIDAIINGGDSSERLKVTEIGWIESEKDRPASWDTEWDAIDILETVREYIN
jgi:peptidoglycan hydrolase-like protein with peptidoglycan-binding domain